MSRFNRGNDSSGHRIINVGLCTISNRSVLINSACEDFVFRFLFNRHGLAGNRRLVNRSLTGKHDTVHGQAFSRNHTYDLADFDVFGRNFNKRSVSLYSGCLRGQREKAANRAASAVQRKLSNRFREFKQNHDHCSFRPRSDQNSAGNRNCHQGIHVEIQVSDRDESFLVSAQAD